MADWQAGPFVLAKALHAARARPSVLLLLACLLVALHDLVWLASTSRFYSGTRAVVQQQCPGALLIV